MTGIGPISAKGAFTGDFGIAPGVAAERVPAAIEHDRVIMTQRPGMQSKHVPLQLDFTTGRVACGGRYLFDRYEDACDYRRWMFEDFVTDGVPFPERSYFVEPTFLAWSVVGAHQFLPLERHAGIRFQRRSTALPAEQLPALYHALRAHAERQALAAVWLLHAPDRGEVGLVTISGRTGESPTDLDQAALDQLTDRASTGAAFESAAAGGNVLDRTGWVWNLWLPRAAAGCPQSLWPNSPPLPAA